MKSKDRAPVRPVPLSVSSLLQQAIAHHQIGQMPQAEALYRQILQVSPDHPDALHLWGMLACQTGNLAVGIELIDRAILFKPDFPEAYNNRGVALQGLRRYQEALESFDKAILLKPDYAEAHGNRGHVLIELGQFQQAIESLDRAILLKPHYTEAYNNRGRALHELQQYQQAVESFDQALLLKPDYAAAHNNRGGALDGLKQYQEAIASFDRAIFLKPDYAGAYNGRGNALQRLRQYQAALLSFDQALLLHPDYAIAHNGRGSALHELRQYPQAIASFDKAILLSPDFAGAYENRGHTLLALQQSQQALDNFDRALLLKPNSETAHDGRGKALHGLERYREAVECYGQAILLKPDYAEAYSNRGSALHALQQYREALESCDQAILLKPDFAEAYNNRGNALLGLHQYHEAVESYDQAILLRPGYVEAYSNRSSALQELRQYQAAVESCDQAILLKPDYAEAYSNRACALLGLQQFQAAVESCDQAILLNPHLGEAHYIRANTLNELQQYPAALESYDRAILLKPNYELLHGTTLYLKQIMCDWRDIESRRRDLEARILCHQKAVIPFSLLAISGSPALQRKAAETFISDNCIASRTPETIGRRPKKDKIRVGYFSADFWNHPICYLMAELFERHDKSRFEVLGFSFGPDRQDEMTIRVTAAMDRFVEVRHLPDPEVAQLSRELEVDIAVDLMGFTQFSRRGIFAQRAAPIQVNYLGYPATMGAEFIDYLIADPTLIPEASQCHYSEKIAYLPDSFQPNDSTRLPSKKCCSRSEENLPERGFVYCCFNSNCKITPETFDIWMRVLARVDGSVLWLVEGNSWVKDNLRKEAARRGVSPERLIFAQWVSLSDHLARLPLADLFLDTLPFNAGATASPALWAGLPILTCMGEAFASRMGASLLRAIDLPELVTTTDADYEAMAVDLALDTDRYHNLRQRLRRNRLTTPLFDVPRFTRHLEAAYSAMYERHQASLPPDHIHISRLP